MLLLQPTSEVFEEEIKVTTTQTDKIASWLSSSTRPAV